MSTHQNAAAPVSKLGYVEFTTPDPERLLDYYRTVLGFHVERLPDFFHVDCGITVKLAVIGAASSVEVVRRRVGRSAATESSAC